MSAQHTPGPWAVEKRYGDVVDVNGRTLCVHGMALTSTEEAKANSLLMAAAPELLATLQELVADIADRFDMDSPSTNPGIKSAIAEARAAIAKAEGTA